MSVLERKHPYLTPRPATPGALLPAPRPDGSTLGRCGKRAVNQTTEVRPLARRAPTPRQGYAVAPPLATVVTDSTSVRSGGSQRAIMRSMAGAGTGCSRSAFRIDCVSGVVSHTTARTRAHGVGLGLARSAGCGQVARGAAHHRRQFARCSSGCVAHGSRRGLRAPVAPHGHVIPPARQIREESRGSPEAEGAVQRRPATRGARGRDLGVHRGLGGRLRLGERS